MEILTLRKISLWEQLKRRFSRKYREAKEAEQRRLLRETMDLPFVYPLQDCEQAPVHSAKLSR